MRAWRGALLYVVYLAVIVVGVSYVVHLRYVRSIRRAHFEENAVIPGIDAALSAQLGAIPPPAERARAFGNFPRAKPPGRIRIGCFGDSFTWGSEVDDGNDYPSILQELAAEAGFGDVEVLSFGSPAFGLHQSVLLWDRVGRDYGLDHVVLLGWGNTWIGRDSTFHYWPVGGRKLGFHARYVLDGDGLALAEVVGLTEAERFDVYMRFVPLLRYLRWDHRAPSFLEAWVPRSRTLENPFYYRDDYVEEIKETYRRLLARVGREAPHPVLVDIDGLLLTLTDACTPPCMPAVRVPPAYGFPYRMFHDHFSPLGNRLVAALALHALFPTPDRVNEMIRVAPAPIAGDPTGEAIPLREAVRIDVTLGDRIVGGLYARPKSVEAERPSRLDTLPAGVQRLVAIVGRGRSLLDAPFLPLSSSDGVPAVALEVDGTTRPLDVQATAVGSRELGLLRLDPCDAAAFRRALGVGDEGMCEVVPTVAELRPGRRSQLLIDGVPAVAVSVDEQHAVHMAPLDPMHYVVLPDANGASDVPGRDGFVDLRLADASGARSAVHLAAWTRVPFAVR
jgi:lysophospholipase L1-like esterase